MPLPLDHRDGPVASVIPDLINRQIWQISWNNLHTCAMVDGMGVDPYVIPIHQGGAGGGGEG